MWLRAVSVLSSVYMAAGSSYSGRPTVSQRVLFAGSLIKERQPLYPQLYVGRPAARSGQLTASPAFPRQCYQVAPLTVLVTVWGETSSWRHSGAS